jgi:uncharacterized protein YdhG (YjbR/CyaY superfamily)
VQTIDEYINQFEPAIKERLQAIRKKVATVAPQAEEKISYGIISFYIGKKCLYVAGYSKHIGIYPFADAGALNEDIAAYRAKKAKHSVHFLHSEKLPTKLLEKLIAFKLLD